MALLRQILLTTKAWLNTLTYPLLREEVRELGGRRGRGGRFKQLLLGPGADRKQA